MAKKAVKKTKKVLKVKKVARRKSTVMKTRHDPS